MTGPRDHGDERAGPGADAGETLRGEPERAERFAALALVAELIVAPSALALAAFSGSQALTFLAIQAGVGILFCAGSLLQLKLTRQAAEEARDRELADRRRREQGLASLFIEDEEGAAARNLRQWQSVLAPGLSLACAVLLALPAVFWLGLHELGPRSLWQFPTEGLHRELLSAALTVILGFSAMLLGLYLGGLSRIKGWGALRAGSGALLVSAALAGGSVAGLAAAERWSLGLDRIIGIIGLAFMALQSLEIGLNFLLDFYRPRTPGVEIRPAFDSRLSGWMTEPKGVFETLAHTLDYQFGFKVSETWFFRFLERAFVPLLLIQLLSFHAMSSFVVVRPGERAIVERWGAPRGVTALPARDEAGDKAWDSLAEPLGPGLHLTWPWPMETVRRFDSERVTTLYVGYEAEDEEGYRKLAQSLNERITTWDETHVESETDYILPLPPELAPDQGPGEAGQGVFDGMLLRTMFTIEYKIGSKRRGDLYRYAYRHREPGKAVRATCERVVTAYFAGAQFWDLIVSDPERCSREILERLREATREAGLGVDVVSFNLEQVHPPAGAVGKAYQDVLASSEMRETLIHQGEVDAARIAGQTPADVNALLGNASAASHRRASIARARAERFTNQLLAHEAAPTVYRNRLLMRAFAESLGEARKVLVPPGVEVRLDRAQLDDPIESALKAGMTGGGKR